MMPYISLDALPRNLICFWAILLLLGFTMNGIWAVRQKRYSYTAAAFVSFLAVYFVMAVCREITTSNTGYALHPLAEKLGGLPVFVYILVLAVFTAVFLIRFHINMLYTRTHITPTAVKEAADMSPAGICYFRLNGQPVLTNHRMNAIAIALTGSSVLNALELVEAVGDRHICELSDGTVVRFSQKGLTFSGEVIRELIADDITDLYRKTETLRKNNEQLQRQNRRMKESGEKIDETVRRQEVLNTKRSIHDEMNRLLLFTDNAIREGTEEEKEQILEIWQKNILLLCMEADTEEKNTALSDLDTLAKVIGITICYDRQPETKEADALMLFSLAAAEAMTNAAKHASAKNLYVQVSEDAAFLTAAFTNDGKPPSGRISEGGGLSALRQCIEQAGGTMTVSTGVRFTLTVVIPKIKKSYHYPY